MGLHETRQKMKALKKVENKEALLLIGSPLCTVLSQLQTLNKNRRDPIKFEKEKKAGGQHLQFCMKLHNKQIDGGRYFLHEHPFTATIWKEKSVTDTMKREGVVNVRSDMCKFGMY